MGDEGKEVATEGSGQGRVGVQGSPGPQSEEQSKVRYAWNFRASNRNAYASLCNHII